jgi:sialic acid synthase SpsE
MDKLSRILSGEEKKPYIIAEISANHGGTIENAKSLMDAAKNAGADAIKLQTFTADSITVNSSESSYFIPSSSNLWGGQNLWSLMKEAETPLEWHPILFEYASSIGMEIFSTAYDIKAAIFLEENGIRAIKVSSFDLVNIPLLTYLSARDVLVLISTGMSNDLELSKAASIFADRKKKTGFLQCTSSYPCLIQDVNINRHTRLQSLGFVTGYSDHTIDSIAATLAIAKGALIFEKHIKQEGANTLDAEFSLSEIDFKKYVDNIHAAFTGLGDFEFSPTTSEMASLWERPSIVALKDIAVGEVLTEDNLGIRRPSIGAPPSYFEALISSPSPFNLKRGEGYPPPKCE